MELLAKFENISGPGLDLREKYMRVLSVYGRDLESVRKQYQKHKMEPIVARNIPPISGKIAWARQLYRKIEAPMKVFKQMSELLKVRDPGLFRWLAIFNDHFGAKPVKWKENENTKCLSLSVTSFFSNPHRTRNATQSK